MNETHTLLLETHGPVGQTQMLHLHMRCPVLSGGHVIAREASEKLPRGGDVEWGFKEKESGQQVLSSGCCCPVCGQNFRFFHEKLEI